VLLNGFNLLSSLAPPRIIGLEGSLLSEEEEEEEEEDEDEEKGD